MKIRTLLESTQRIPIYLEIQRNLDDEDSIEEIEAELEFNWATPRAATRIDPAEGGVEVENIIINGKSYNTTEELRQLGVITGNGDFDTIADLYIDDMNAVGDELMHGDPDRAYDEYRDRQLEKDWN